MLCQACHRPAPGFLCPACLRRLRPAPERILGDGVRLVAAFRHEGVARELVHHLKYRGLTGFADLVVDRVADRLPAWPVVPVPRVWTRQVRYGVDPAREIGIRLARALDVPLLDLLRPSLYGPRRAGGDHSRPPAGLSASSLPQGPYLLVDDVVTTGATVAAARKSLEMGRLTLVVAATAADMVSSPRLPRGEDQMKHRFSTEA